MAPDGSSLLTLDVSSVQTAIDGSRRIVWMIKRMIKRHLRESDGKASEPAPTRGSGILSHPWVSPIGCHDSERPGGLAGLGVRVT